MRYTRQPSLHDTLSVMLRGLTGVAAAVPIVFLVIFTPYADLKDTSAAAAQSRPERTGNGARGAPGRGRAGDIGRGVADSLGRASNGIGGGNLSSGDNRSGIDSGPGNSEPGNSEPGSPGAGNQGSGDRNPADDQPSDSTGKTPPNGALSTSDTASKKPPSGSLFKPVPRGGFTGDSEPSGEPLSRQEEQEAIQNGWK